MFIKGFYDHATILSSKGTIVEAVGDKFVDGKNTGGVREVDLEEWLYKKDHVALIRVNHASAFAAGMNALKYIGRGYDYYFKHGEEKVYCSELPYLCYRTEWPEFLAEFEGDEILPQLYLDYSKHNIAPYLECLVDTRANAKSIEQIKEDQKVLANELVQTQKIMIEKLTRIETKLGINDQ